MQSPDRQAIIKKAFRENDVSILNKSLVIKQLYFTGYLNQSAENSFKESLYALKILDLDR